jgi:hypothetical protein
MAGVPILRVRLRCCRCCCCFCSCCCRALDCPGACCAAVAGASADRHKVPSWSGISHRSLPGRPGWTLCSCCAHNSSHHQHQVPTRGAMMAFVFCSITIWTLKSLGCGSLPVITCSVGLLCKQLAYRTALGSASLQTYSHPFAESLRCYADLYLCRWLCSVSNIADNVLPQTATVNINFRLLPGGRVPAGQPRTLNHCSLHCIAQQAACAVLHGSSFAVSTRLLPAAQIDSACLQDSVVHTSCMWSPLLATMHSIASGLHTITWQQLCHQAVARCASRHSVLAGQRRAYTAGTLRCIALGQANLCISPGVPSTGCQDAALHHAQLWLPVHGSPNSLLCLLLLQLMHALM